VHGGKFEIGNSEAYEVGGGVLRRTIGANRAGHFEHGIEHRQCPQSDTKDQFVEVLEDIVDRSDGAADVMREIARLQAGEPVCSDSAFGGIDQPLSQHRVMVALPRHHQE
jgi:hypothetical protein